MRKIIDAHCHIYPAKIAERAVEGIMNFYHLTEEQKPLEGTVEGLFKYGEMYGVSHYLCHSVATVPAQVRSINSFIASEVEAHPGKITGFGTLHPDSEDLVGDIEHLISLGLKGVKIHPDFQNFSLDDEKGMMIGNLISSYNLPVMTHCGDKRYDRSNPPQVLAFAKAHPDLRIIAAHLGGWSRWDEAVRLLKGLPNVWFDCSSTFSNMSPEKGLELVRTLGADRIMFGTDYPMWHTDVELANIEALGLTEEEKDQIFYKTFVDFIGLDGNDD